MMGRGSVVFAVWGYVIAHTGPDSLVEINPGLLAILLGEKEEGVNEALSYLEAPDPLSRSKGHEGKRLIKKGEFLYFVPQANKYRGLPNDKARKEYFAEKQREHRQRLTDSQTGKSKESNSVKECQTSSTASSSSLVRSRGTKEEVVQYCISIGLPASDGEAMFLHWQEKGWGKVKDWKLTIQKWRSFGYLPSQKSAKVNQRSMSAFEIEKRQAAIKDEINAIFRRNGSKRVDGDGIDELKKRRDQLQQQLVL